MRILEVVIFAKLFSKKFLRDSKHFPALQPSTEENGSKDETADGKKSNEEYDQLKSDYEDLLVLLEDQDAKIQQYKVCIPRDVSIRRVSFISNLC